MESPDFFAPLPLSMDAQTKVVSASSNAGADLASELAKLNATHRALQQLDPPTLTIPPPPQQINPKRSQQIGKMRETALGALSKKSGKEALPAPAASAGTSATSTPQPVTESTKLFGLAIDMALQRPEWEASGLRREELANLYRGRAEAFMAIRAWADGLVDAQISLECKPKANAAALARAGKCLAEMQRAEEANSLIAPSIQDEINGLEQAKQQVSQIPANHPQLAQAKAQIAAIEKDMEELKSVARELSISF